MTRFEASVIMFMVMAIMLLLVFGIPAIISLLNDIEKQHENMLKSIKHIDTILSNGFKQTGRSNGGSNIEPKYKN